MPSRTGRSGGSLSSFGKSETVFGFLMFLALACAFLLMPLPTRELTFRGARAFSMDWWDGALPTYGNLVGTTPKRPNFYPIPSSDRPEGAFVILAPFLALFDAFGLNILAALSVALGYGFLFLSVLGLEKGSRSFPAVALSSVFCALFYLDRLWWPHNQYAMPTLTRLAVMFSAALLFLFARGGSAKGGGKSWYGMAGAFAGFLVGARHELVIVFAVLAGAALLSRKKGAWAALVGFLAVCWIWALWHYVNFGNPLVHEVQVGLDESMPEFYRQCIGPVCFLFNGLLNFQGGIVRTPVYSYPVFLLIPIKMISAFGAALSAFLLLGIWTAFSRERERAPFAAAALLLLIFLGSMENWTPQKTAIAFMIMPFLAFLCFSAILLFIRNWAAWLPWIVVSFLSVVVFLAAVAPLEGRFPEDLRWYLRFNTTPEEAYLRRSEDGNVSVSDISILPAKFPFPAEARGARPAWSFADICGGFPFKLLENGYPIMVYPDMPPELQMCAPGIYALPEQAVEISENEGRRFFYFASDSEIEIPGASSTEVVFNGSLDGSGGAQAIIYLVKLPESR